MFADVATANRQLEPLDMPSVEAADLPELLPVHQAAVAAADALVNARPVDCSAVNDLARASTGRLEIHLDDDGTLKQELVWSDPSIASRLARRLVQELTTLDPLRVRRCARPECDLFFYDTTRSRSQRWHAESPCGWRQRQRRRRGKPDSV